MRPPSPSVPTTDLLALLGCGLAWGLTPAVTKLGGYSGIPVLAWSCLQALTAALFLGVLVLARRRAMPRGWHGLAYCGFAGVIGLAFPNVLLFLGMQRVPAGFFALLAPLSPVLTALFLGLSGQERVDQRIVWGSVLASAGTLLAMLPGAALPDREALPWAAVLLLVPTAYAVTNAAAAVWRPGGIDGIALATGTLGATAAFLLPVALAAGHFDAPVSTWAAAAPWIVVQGALQAIAFTLYFRLIVHRGGVFASQVAYIITLSGVVWGMALFAERFGWLTVPAALLVFAGLYLLTRR